MALSFKSAIPLLIALLTFSTSKSYSQNKTEEISHIDSLLELSNEINEAHLDSSIKLAKEALLKSEQGGYELREAYALDRLGFFMDRKANFPKGIEYYRRSANIKTKVGRGGLAWTLGEIGYAYDMLGNVDSAIFYFEKSRTIAINTKSYGTAALQGVRIGRNYLENENLAKAKSEFERSLKLVEGLDDYFVNTQCFSGLYHLFMRTGDSAQSAKYALLHLKEAIKSEDKRMISTSHIFLGNNFLSNGNKSAAKRSFNLAMSIADSIADRNTQIDTRLELAYILMFSDSAQQSLVIIQQAEEIAKSGTAVRNVARCLDAKAHALLYLDKPNQAKTAALQALQMTDSLNNLGLKRSALDALWRANKKLGNLSDALHYFERLNAVIDSIDNEEFSKSVLRSELQQKFALQVLEDSLSNETRRHNLQLEYQQQIIKEKRTRNSILFGSLLVLLTAIGLWSRLRYTRQASAAISREKDKSDSLLLNILPQEVAEELKEKGEAETRYIEEASVLFTDFKDFTELSEKVKPKDLVEDLNRCFSEFDRICAKHKIEKIKTIGDAYMAASGIPIPSENHAKNITVAAIEMRDFIDAEKKRKMDEGLPYFEIRIGIHSGPLITGIVGIKKFQYDIWGDTVNTASRMESNGQVGKVNISRTTYSLLKDSSEFIFKHRGKIEAKGKGEIDMFFVDRNKATA